MKFQTRAVNSVGPSQFGETMPPVVQSSAFAYETPQDLEAVFEGRQFGHVYSRISNPTVSSLEQKLTQLEQGRGSVAVASGMAAVHAVCLALAKSGDSIVVSTSLFGGTYLLFKDVRVVTPTSFTLPAALFAAFNASKPEFMCIVIYLKFKSFTAFIAEALVFGISEIL